MIRYTSNNQLPLAGFETPFETTLDSNNRWGKLATCTPWDELAEAYYSSLHHRHGRPAKDARLVIGAVIIKHKGVFVRKHQKTSFNWGGPPASIKPGKSCYKHVDGRLICMLFTCKGNKKAALQPSGQIAWPRIFGDTGKLKYIFRSAIEYKELSDSPTQ